MVRSPVATEGSILATNSFVMFCHRFSNLYWAHLRKCLGVWKKTGRTRNYPYSTLVPTHPTFFPARFYPAGNPWFSHNDPYFFNGFCEVKTSYSLDMVLKDLGCLFQPNPDSKKTTSAQIQQSCGKGAHPKGRTVCEYNYIKRENPVLSGKPRLFLKPWKFPGFGWSRYTWIFKRLIYFDLFGCLPIMVETA